MTESAIGLDEISSRLGLGDVPEVLEAAAVPIRRGHHLALLAGEGSGRRSVIGLAVLEICDAADEGLQALVLVPESGDAWRTAAAVQRIVAPEGFRVSCPSAAPDGERPPEELPAAAEAHVLVGRPSSLLPEIRAGRHSIADLRLLVLDRVADMHALGEWRSVEPILETLPEGSRKIAISDRFVPAFSDLVVRQLPRARRWPEELIPVGTSSGGEGEVDDEEDAGGPAPVRCAVAREADFAEVFEALARDADRLGCQRLELVLPTPEFAARAAAKLAVAGLTVGRDVESVIGVELPGQGAAAVVHVGLPSRLERMAEAMAGEGPRYVVVEPRHLPQMLLDMRRIGRRTEPLGSRLSAGELDSIRHYRMRLRDAAATADTMSELLVLEPLFEEMGAVRVAAVLSSLLREHRDEPVAARPWPDAEAASFASGAADTSARGARRREEEPPRGARPAWTRLYFGVGRRDEARPDDLVGAITGEAGIAGAQVGKVEMMGNFSLVEIDSQVADRVMQKLDGVQIRGRTVPVRRDRES